MAISISASIAESDALEIRKRAVEVASRVVSHNAPVEDLIEAARKVEFYLLGKTR